MTSNQKMGAMIAALVGAVLVIAAWNFYIAFLLLPVIFVGAIFTLIGVNVARSLTRRSGHVDE